MAQPTNRNPKKQSKAPPNSNGAEPEYDPFEPGPDTTWGEVNLDAALAGKRGGEPPTIGKREDSQCLIYKAKVHAINSPSEAGKTFIALAICAQETAQGHHVAYLDFEDSDIGIVERLRDLGVEKRTIKRFFHYFRPDEPLVKDAENEFQETLASYDPVTLAVIDGVTEALAMHGFNVDSSNTDIANFMAMLPRPLTRAGIAVLALDHVTKIVAEGRQKSRFAMGPQHKLSGSDGVTYSLENVRHFSRGHDGSATLKVNKDRPGWVRANAPGDVAAKVRFVGGEKGAMTVEIGAPSEFGGSGKVSLSIDDAKHQKALAIAERVLKEQGSFVSGREACRAMVAIDPDIGRKPSERAIEELVDSGKAERGPEGVKRARPIRWAE